jgi:hypothetical protein
LVGELSKPAEDEVFCQFLSDTSDKSDPALGAMLRMLKNAKKSVDPGQSLFGQFAGWLRANRPSYFKRIGQLREYMMGGLRNREDHANLKSITEADADKMFEASKEVISLLNEDLAQQNPG